MSQNDEKLTSFDQFAEVFQIEIPEEALPKMGLSKKKCEELEQSELERQALIEIFHTYLQDIASQLQESDDHANMQLKIRLTGKQAYAVLFMVDESEIESYPSIEALYMRTPETKERIPVFLFTFFVGMPEKEEQYEVTIAQKVNNQTCKGKLHVLTESKEMDAFFDQSSNQSILEGVRTLFSFEDPRFEINIESMQQDGTESGLA